MTIDLNVNFSDYSIMGLIAMQNRTKRFLKELGEEIEKRDDSVVKIGDSVIIF
jgi:sporulation protein YlmC with PRC-barrel domain